MNSVDVEIDEPIPPTEEGETSSEVSEVYYFHFFLLDGMLFFVRSVSGFNVCLCTNSLKETDSNNNNIIIKYQYKIAYHRIKIL